LKNFAIHTFVCILLNIAIVVGSSNASIIINLNQNMNPKYVFVLSFGASSE